MAFLFFTGNNLFLKMKIKAKIVLKQQLRNSVSAFYKCWALWHWS